MKFKREELSKYLVLFAPKAAHDRVLLQKKSFESAIKNDFIVKGKNYFGFYKVPEISVEVVTPAVVVRNFALKTKSLETN